jgi:hypothetical protein
MPGSIPAPNSGSFVEKKNKKNIGSKMGQTDQKKTFKNLVIGDPQNRIICNPLIIILLQ